MPEALKRIRAVEIEHGGAVVEGAGQVDAELLEYVALHLGDRHLEHDLVAPVHGDAVDHLGAGADQARGDVIGLLRVGRVCRRAGEHDAIADAFDADVGIRQRPLECGAHAIQVARHGDVEAGDLPAVGIEEEDIGLPDLDADHVNAARGADHRIGDIGIGHQHVLDVGRQVDGDRFADTEPDGARGRFARRNLDHRRVRVGTGRRSRRRQAGGEDQSRQRGVADRCPSRHVP